MEDVSTPQQIRLKNASLLRYRGKRYGKKRNKCLHSSITVLTVRRCVTPLRRVLVREFKLWSLFHYSTPKLQSSYCLLCRRLHQPLLVQQRYWHCVRIFPGVLIEKPNNGLSPPFSPDFTWNRQIWRQDLSAGGGWRVAGDEWPVAGGGWRVKNIWNKVLWIKQYGTVQSSPQPSHHIATDENRKIRNRRSCL